MNNVLDNHQRSKTAIICFYIYLGFFALVLYSNYMQYTFLNKNVFQLISGAKSNDQRQILIAVIAGIAQIVLIVTFIQWFRRGYHNLHKAGVKKLDSTEGFAAGSWFIPIVHWFKPFLIMRDIWVKTDDYNRSHKSDDEEILLEPKKSLNLIGFWWATWVSTSLINIVVSAMVRNQPDISSLKTATLLSMASNIIGIICIFLIIKIIKESQKDQDKFLIAWKEGESSDGLGISDSDDILD